MEKKDVFVSFIKGIITGIATLVPGVSPAAVILSINSYENVVKSFHDLTKKNNDILLFVTVPLIVGLLLGLIGGIHLIDHFWNNFKVQTLLLFAGLVLGGIRIIFKKQKLNFNKKTLVFYIFISLVFGGLFYLLKDVVILSNVQSLSSFCIFSVITGMSFLIPGLPIITMKLDSNFKYLVSLFKHISGFSIGRIVIFILVLILVISLLAKTSYKLIDSHRRKVYIVLCSLMFASVVISLLQIDNFTFNFVNIFTSIIAFLWGFIFAKNVERE